MLKNYIDKNNKVSMLPKKYSKKIEVLEFLANKFEKGKEYTEIEVNNILNENHSFNDCCIIRRELYSNSYLGRSENCKKYWRIEKSNLSKD